jgi:Fe-S-cluster-containing dehydrogenase component
MESSPISDESVEEGFMLSDENKCFYCEYEIEGRPYFINFFSGTKERDEALCDVCYADWLAGIKG